MSDLPRRFSGQSPDSWLLDLLKLVASAGYFFVITALFVLCYLEPLDQAELAGEYTSQLINVYFPLLFLGFVSGAVCFLLFNSLSTVQMLIVHVTRGKFLILPVAYFLIGSNIETIPTIEEMTRAHFMAVGLMMSVIFVWALGDGCHLLIALMRMLGAIATHLSKNVLCVKIRSLIANKYKKEKPRVSK